MKYLQRSRKHDERIRIMQLNETYELGVILHPFIMIIALILFVNYMFKGEPDQAKATIIVSGITIAIMLGYINIWTILVTCSAFIITTSIIAYKRRQSGKELMQKVEQARPKED